jgi:CHAD domain-containing protein
METLRVIKGVLPEEGVDAVLEDLRKIMDAAGEVRSCDIAAELLHHAGALDISPLMTELAERRTLAERKLFERAHDAYRRNATQKWRSALLPTELPAKPPAKSLPAKPPAKAQP